MDEVAVALNGLDPGVQAILLTASLGILGWVVQAFIHGPIERSRETFMSILDKRLRIISQVRGHLAMINLLEPGKEAMEIKEKLQNLLLTSDYTGFLDQSMYANVLRIAMTESTDRESVHKVLREINADIGKWSTKIEGEIALFMKHHDPNPIWRLLLSVLTLVRSTVAIALFFGLIYLLFVQLVQMPITVAVVVCVVLLAVVWTAYRLVLYYRWIYLNSMMAKAKSG